MKPKLIRITTVPISLKLLLADQLRFMNNYFDVLAVSSPGKELEEVAEQEGINVFPIAMTRKITPFKDLVSLLRMFFLFLREKPCIVHTHTPKAGIVGMLAARLTGVPHRLHTVAGLPVMEATGKKKKILLAVEKLTYACATNVYPNSKGLYTYILQQRLCLPQKLAVIGEGSSNGIDTDYFKRTPSIESRAEEIRNTYALHDRFVFCFVGRIVKDKGVNELIHAFDQLSKRYTHISLLLVGSKENDLDPIDIVTHRLIETHPHIHTVGFQHDIRPYLAASDCFVLPTYREGFPNVVLQACSMELPCIVTDINGCNEIIQDGKNGLVVPPKDEDALFFAMQRFMKNPDLTKQLSLTVRDDIVRFYDRKRFHRLLLEEYRKVLNTHDKDTV